MRLQILGLLVGLISVVSAISAAGNKLLVVIGDEAEKSRYSQFWADLESRGFQTTFATPKSSSLTLFTHGVPTYTHLLLLPLASKGLGTVLSPANLVEFLNSGSNILLALSADNAVPVAIANLLAEIDISLSPERTSLVVDHFNYDTSSASEKHDVLLIPASKSKAAVKNFFDIPGTIAFPRAVGQVLGNASPLLAPVLKAPSTAYTYNPKSEDGEAIEDVFASGSQISLVSAFQARNSARFTVLGSAESLEDKWFDASVQAPSTKAATKTANKAFAAALTAWTFKEVGVLRVGEVQHYLNEGAQKGVTNTSSSISSPLDLNPTIYRIKNEVHYSIALSEWTHDHWAPFTPPAGDSVQLEFSMLSPFHRLNLKPSGTTDDATVFSAEFKLPDQHGIFNFFTEYRRPFYTNVEEKRTVTVRHFAHDEWPRSFVISGAWPWISGIWVTVAGWLAFVCLWLYSKPSSAKVDLKIGGGKR